MRITICALTAAALLLTNVSFAQHDSEDSEEKKHGQRSITISNKGISIVTTNDTTGEGLKAGKMAIEKAEKAGKFKTTFMMFDLGVNLLNDNTDYTQPSVVNYLNVPAANRNENLFDLRNGKSINVNIYPVMVKLLAVKTKNQRLYISTGLGFQVYNFRYENNISYRKNPNSIVMDTVAFNKNKLAVNYLNMPLMLTGKTRLHKGTWLVYGGGITGGYRLSSWNKQRSDARGKVKTKGSFDLADFNSCLTAEFGIEGILRFYASYQLTSMYDNGIDQRPICFGLRFGGI